MYVYVDVARSFGTRDRTLLWLKLTTTTMEYVLPLINHSVADYTGCPFDPSV